MRRLDQLATPSLRLAAALALAAGMGAAPGSTAHAAPSPLRFDRVSTAQLPPPTPTPGAGTEVTLLPGQETTVVPGFPPSPPVPIGYTRAAEQLQALIAAQALAAAALGQTQPTYALVLVMLSWPGLYLPIPAERPPRSMAPPRSHEEGSHVKP